MLDRTSHAVLLGVLGPWTLLVSGSAEAALKHVPGQFATIQEALDDALPGDVIMVAPGTYGGTGNTVLNFWGKPVTLLGAGGPSQCTLADYSTVPIFKFDHGETAATVVEGFTITAQTNPGSRGVGMELTASSSPTVRNCRFLNCQTKSQGATVYGGAVYCSAGSSPRFLQCRFVGNRAVSGDGSSASARAYGGAVYADNTSAPLFLDCQFQQNEAIGSAEMAADAFGGAVFGNSLVFLNCTFIANLARGVASWGGRGGAIYANQATLVNCLVANNTAEGRPDYFTPRFGTAYGGAIRTNSLEMWNCTLASNLVSGTTTADGHGGAIYGQFTGTLAVRNSILWENRNQTIANQAEWVATSTASARASTFENGLPPGMTDLGGNLAGNPLFLSAAARDYRLQISSPALDAGDNGALPADLFDLDNDGDITEPLPVDLLGHGRRIDVPEAPDAGFGTPPLADMGAYERTLDNLESIDDWPDFADCFSGPQAAPSPTPPLTNADCLMSFDSDGDGDVDLYDFALCQPPAGP